MQTKKEVDLKHECRQSNFFGPVEIFSQVYTAMKAYCCLFTCLTIRAIHIEVTRNLQKESIIITFQGFFSRRWLPERIHSDNALYITSTSHTFKESSFTTTEIQKQAESKTIAWKFIPPGAHILVDHGKASLGWATDSSLSPDLGNSGKTVTQPLFAKSKLYWRTSVSSDIRDVESLTQGHFWQEWQQDSHPILQLAATTEEQENYGTMSTVSWTSFGHVF